MLNRRIRQIFICLCVMSHLAVAQLPDKTAGSTLSIADVGEIRSNERNSTPVEIQEIHRRLDELEAENATLKSTISSMANSSNPEVDGVTPASFSHFNVDAGCGEYCSPKFASASAGGEQPTHLFGVALEKLSWNKPGGWRIVPFGRLRGEAIYSSAPQTGDAVVVFLNPNNPGINEDQMTVHAKQSQLNFAVTGPNLGDFKVGGTFLMNFMGSQPLRNFSGANIVVAYGEFRNDEWRYAFGRMLDLFGPISPTTVNQISQRGAGNIGIYRGALHLDRFFTRSDIQRWTVSGRISQQDISDFAGVPGIRGKDNGWPNLEGRIGIELGCQQDFGRPFELGISGVIGETQAVADPAPGLVGFLPAIDDIAQTRGAAIDFQWKSESFGVRGEAWWGQAAGTYFIATLQSLNPETAQAIESVGGWAEIYYRMKPNLTTHVGYGIDDPRDGDLGFLNPAGGVGQISQNSVAWWNAIWNVTENFEMGFEVSHRQTQYLERTAANSGTLFHLSSTLRF